MFYAILDDIIKLENQIPLFVILKLLELEEERMIYIIFFYCMVSLLLQEE